MYKIDEALCETTTDISGKKLGLFLESHIDRRERFDLYEWFFYGYLKLNPCLIAKGEGTLWSVVSRNMIEMYFENNTDVSVEELYVAGDIEQLLNHLLWFYEDFCIVNVSESNTNVTISLRVKNPYEMARVAEKKCNEILKNIDEVVDIVDSLCDDYNVFGHSFIVGSSILYAFFGIDSESVSLHSCSVDKSSKTIEGKLRIEINPIVLRCGKEKELDEYIREELRKKLSP